MSLKSTCATNGSDSKTQATTRTEAMVQSNTSATIINETNGEHDEKESKPLVNVIKLRAPSFIRIFVINRILFGGMNDNLVNCTDLVNQCFTTNMTSSRSKDAITILQQLKNNGIKKYMSKCYNEKQYGITIEMIFNKITLKKFAKEYKKVINFNNNYCYESLVLNTNDLMSKIFQYFTNETPINGDLYHCSLLNSHWLYHSWNINSIYHFELETIIIHTLKCGDNDDNVVTRAWQRLINVKSINFNAFSRNAICSNTVLNKATMLTNVERFKGFVDESYVQIVDKILRTSKDKIKRLDVCICMQSPKENVLPPRTFPNAQHIQMNIPYFYITWSKTCDTLELTTTSKNWCEYVINNCDCSGIKFLHFHNVTFSFNDQLLIKQFAMKFKNLNRLKFGFLNQCDSGVLLFWKSLKETIDKNNVKIELKMKQYLNKKEYNKLNSIIDESKLKIDQIYVVIDDRYNNQDCIKKIIVNSNLKWLDIYVTTGNSQALSSIISHISNKYTTNEKLFELLNTVAINGSSTIKV